MIDGTEKFTIYTSATIPECIFCDRAKTLLNEYGIKFDEVVIGRDITKTEFQEEYGKDVKTVPQIFIDGRRIGGYDALNEVLRNK
jgi:glutaredoxin